MKNKGFTLVELIIVVAVIAILAGVLAPQYLQYVERTRESNDIQIATSLMDAAVIAIADPANNVPPNSIIEVAWSTDPEVSLQGALVIRNPVCKSTMTANGVLGYVDNDVDVSQEVLTKLDIVISTILQADTSTANTISNDYYKPLIEKAQSEVANAEDFIYHINTSTGEVVLSNESYAWIDKMGLNANK